MIIIKIVVETNGQHILYYFIKNIHLYIFFISERYKQDAAAGS